MSVIYTPNKFAKESNLCIANLDLKKSLEKYEDNGKNFLALGTFKLGKSSIKLHLKGELSTDGISSTDFNRVPSYSFGIRLDDDEDLESFETFNNLLSESLTDCGDGWELSNIVKDDIIYIKLKVVDKKRFVAASNIKLDPKKLGDSGLYRGQKVSVFGELGAYYNLADKKAGVTFNLRKLAFEQETDE